jgi:hypothetical protein
MYALVSTVQLLVLSFSTCYWLCEANQSRWFTNTTNTEHLCALVYTTGHVRMLYTGLQ